MLFLGGSIRNITINRDLLWPWFECFPGSSMVTIQTPENTPKNISIAELDVNDRVLTSDQQTGAPAYSKVVSFLHRVPDIDAKFVRLHFGHSEFITLTARHLVLVKAHNANEFKYIPAASVQKSDSLQAFTHHSGQIKEVIVLKIEELELEMSGIFAPLTEAGTLIVDGIQASSYSIVKSHSLAQFFFNMLHNLSYLIQLTPASYEAVYRHLYNFVEVTNLKGYLLNIS
jgi:hypothetical protein